MSIKILNIQAASIYEKNCGVRDHLDTTPAVLTDSLFFDFLQNNGMHVWKGKSTRDVIGVAFDYGTRSYEEERKRLEKLLETYDDKDRIKVLIDECDANKDKYKKIRKKDLRTLFYRDGVKVDYDNEIIDYRMLYRTPGKAKKGVCMFIRKSLYKKAREFLYMGIHLPEKNAPIVEIGAYSSLVTSGLVGNIRIEPENILILKDYESFMENDVVSIETDENNHCIAVDREKYRLSNVLFDGQALIDSSIFPKWADGYILLRHHFFKAAAFCTNIQLFFKDYCKNKGLDYNTFMLTDMFGNRHYARDIQMITTDNACKWLKLSCSYEYWCEWVRKNKCMFGIVKTSHPSKLGDVQRMSYQMTNSLDGKSMKEVMRTSENYLIKLQTDDDVFLEYLRRNKNFANDYEVLCALVEQNRDFLKSDYFRERKKKIIGRYTRELKMGRLIQNADNLTIVGNPYGMLLHAVGEDPETDPTFEHEDDSVQCYTKRFKDGEYLAAFRSPMNSRNNIDYLHNHYHEYFDKYFYLGTHIIAVNMVHTEFQDRNNGLTYWAS